MRPAVLIVYQLGAIATWIYLTFFNGFHYNWWNWIIALTVNPFLAEIWPLFWLLILPFNNLVLDRIFGGNHVLSAVALAALLVAWFCLAAIRRAKS